MSDGPHKTLPMRPAWRRVAKRGDISTFAPDQVSAALIPALQKDCQAETTGTFLDDLVNLCLGQDTSLFKDDIGSQLETLRAEAGPGLGRKILDEAIRFAAGGEQGTNIAVRALNSALTDRAVKGARQVEEHYLRESTNPRAARVRDRIHGAIGLSGDAIEGLTYNILGLGKERSAIRPVKQQGLDDGVSL